MKSAIVPFVIQFFAPSMTQPSAVRSAVVTMVWASEPLIGSVSPKHPSFWPDAHGARTSRFCSAVPNFRTGSQKRELLTLRMTPHDAQAALISSITRA